jgi:hypothetical protein
MIILSMQQCTFILNSFSLSVQIKAHRSMEPVKSCKFGFNCENASCGFNHPDRTACRYGGGCTRPGCWFNHKVRVSNYEYYKDKELTKLTSIARPETGCETSHNASFHKFFRTRRRRTPESVSIWVRVEASHAFLTTLDNRCVRRRRLALT